MADAPAFVRLVNRIAVPLMALGVPAGPNALLTVRGRRTGTLRTTPVAVLDLGGRHWIQSPFGEVNWVRNLRAAREADLRRGRHRGRVEAVALTRTQARDFFAEVLPAFLVHFPAPVRTLIPKALGLDLALKDPAAAAERFPVFELKDTPA